MIFSWVSSKYVVSRIMRNIKGVESEYVDDIPEWIAEGVAALKTRYSLVMEGVDVPIQFHLGRLNATGVAPICAEHKGYILKFRHDHNRNDWAWQKSYIENLFTSQVPIYSTAGDPITSLDAYTGGNPFPRDIIERLIDCPENPEEWWTIEGQTIKTSLKDTCIRVYYWVFPKDNDTGLPLIPDVEEYQEALYWYVRMKLVEAGYNDIVFKWETLHHNWEQHAGRAIGAVTYPSPEEGIEMMNRHLNYFPHLYNWGAFLDWWGGE